jgi:L-ascorbate metabolism protein UlaG (beta-lactamase superfamily)
MNNQPLSFRWLGVAGVEIRYNGFSLLVDPYLSRISLKRFLFCKAVPDEKKILSAIPRADAILVTHGHFDHLMDVPVIAREFMSRIYGSPGTCSLLRRSGVLPAQINEVAPGDDFQAGPFRVSVEKSSHSFLFFFTAIARARSETPPQRAVDFGMDSILAYRISIGKRTFLTDPGREVKNDAVDILFVNTLQGRGVCSRILETIDPDLVIPIHWDNYFKPFSRQSRAPSWGWMPIKRILLKTLRKKVVALTPRGRLFIPEPFVFYRMDDVFPIAGTDGDGPRFFGI